MGVQCIQVTFDSCVSKVILRLFGAFTIFDNLLSRKRAVVERNGVIFRLRGEYASYTWYVLTVKVLKVILGSVGCISDFRQPCISKRPFVECKRMKFGPRGESSMYTRYFQQPQRTCLRSFWGHSVHSQFLTTLYLKNDWMYSDMDWNLGSRGDYSVYTGYF